MIKRWQTIDHLSFYAFQYSLKFIGKPLFKMHGLLLYRAGVVKGYCKVNKNYSSLHFILELFFYVRKAGEHLVSKERSNNNNTTRETTEILKTELMVSHRFSNFYWPVKKSYLTVPDLILRGFFHTLKAFKENICQ